MKIAREMRRAYFIRPSIRVNRHPATVPAAICEVFHCWLVVRDEFEEGGYKQSGPGRLRGLASLDDFVESKHIVLQPGVAAR
jgi:acyl-CoA reductase-like NAD-dependent aldehyde dehydrogenase